MFQVKLQLGTKGVASHGEARSWLLVVAEELAALKDEVVLQFSGHKLDKKDFFGKSDPFLEIYKSTESNEFSLVHKTEVGKQSSRVFRKDILLLTPTSFGRHNCRTFMSRKLKNIYFPEETNNFNKLRRFILEIL